MGRTRKVKRISRRRTNRVKRSRINNKRVKRSKRKSRMKKGGYLGEELRNRFKNRIQKGDMIRARGGKLIKETDFTTPATTDGGGDIPSTWRWTVRDIRRKRTHPNFGTKYLEISGMNGTLIKLIKASDAEKLAGPSGTTHINKPLMSGMTHHLDQHSY